MRGENNILLRGIRTYPTPWQWKSTEASHRPYYEIVDYEGVKICGVHNTTGVRGGQSAVNTAKLIASAPLLLAAVTEYAAKADARGELTPELVELILDAGGVDLRDRLAPKPERSAEKISHKEEEPKPRKWNNKTQSVD